MIDSALTKDPILTEEFQAAFDLLESTDTNVFLTGNAGTGKSTFLQYFRKHTTKNIAVVAPTGVAALNVRGQTIHSMFRFKPGFVDPAKIKTTRKSLFKELDLLVIDEVSMVRADVFDGIDLTLKRARRSQQPFGGLQVCIIGDLFQLPPVVTREEMAFYTQHYESPFFFATEAYKSADFETIQFSTIHRQADEDFIHVLNEIRSGHCSTDSLDHLNTRFLPKVVPAPGTLVLTTTNALAENINRSQLAKLHSQPRIYQGDVQSKFGMTGARLPAPDPLELKVGAQVMFVKNDPGGRWVNGTIGIIEAFEEERIRVTVKHETFDVKPEKWQTITYEYDEDKEKIVEKVLGSYQQFPLQLAWAITIHKSQGKTLDRVIIDLGSGTFAAGQLYVALSRCKALSGIALKQPITPHHLQSNEEVVAFMHNA